MQFKLWLEFNYPNTKEVIIPKGTVLYHGTLESFDTRSPKPGGDRVFWTTDDTMIARSYIPSHHGYLAFLSLRNLRTDAEFEPIRKQLGLNEKMIAHAYQIQQKTYNKIEYWNDRYKELAQFHRDHQHDIDALTDEFFQQWMQAEEELKKARTESRWFDQIIDKFLIQKMKLFGYEVQNDGFRKIITDKDGKLVPAKQKSVGKVLVVTCLRDFTFLNYTYNRNEGDLMDPDHLKYDLITKIEEKGYDGIIIHDFAQTDYHGNYGHRSFGFFKKATKDLSIKQMRNQTHPYDHEWKSSI